MFKGFINFLVNLIDFIFAGKKNDGKVDLNEVVKEMQYINILNHNTSNFEINKYSHEAIVETNRVGDTIDFVSVVAKFCGYHPSGYNCWNEEVKKIKEGVYFVRWTSFNTCH